MDTTFGEIVLLSLTASIVAAAACREVVLCARWISNKRRPAEKARGATAN